MPVISALRSSSRVLLALALVHALAAQQPSAWTELVPPSGFDPSKLTLLNNSGTYGKLVVYRDGQYLQVYSTVTGQWHGFTPSFGTTPILLHDILLVPESDRYTAFSAYRGVFEVLFVNYAATNLTTGKTTAVVREGTATHVFSSFTGQWHHRTIDPTWSATITERLTVFRKNVGFNGLVLFDALSGAWFDFPALGSDQLSQASMNGSLYVALIRRPNSTHYLLTYSTHQPGWQQHDVTVTLPRLGSSNVTGIRTCDFAGAFDTAFSAHTNTATSLGQPVPIGIVGPLGLAYDLTTSQTWCLGIRGNAWQAMPVGSQPMIDFGGYASTAVALFALGNQTLAFSAFTNTFASVPRDLGPFPWAAGSVQGTLVGAVADVNTGDVAVYATRTGQWHPLPMDVLPEPGGPFQPTPVGNNTSVLLATTSGVAAFSGRTLAVVPLAGSGFVRDGRGFVRNGTRLVFFDARTDRWLDSPVYMAGWIDSIENELVVANTTHAVGYGARSSRLEATSLAEPAQSYLALDGGGVVVTANRVLSFTALPDILSLYGFPEDFELCGPGATFRMQLRLPAGNTAVTGLSAPVTTPLTLPGLGTLWLDPANMIVLGPLTGSAGEQRAALSFSLPNLPALSGTEWNLQSLIVPAAGTPYLSDFTTFLLF